MKNNKKITTILSLFLALVFMTACSNDDRTKTDTTQVGDSTEQANDTTSEEAQTIIDGLKISIDEQEINQKKTDNGNRPLYTFTVSGENMGSVPIGLGSIDFLLETEEGELLVLDESMAMFGDEIAVGDTIEGTVSFELKDNQKAEKLVYKPGKEKLAEWDVKSE